MIFVTLGSQKFQFNRLLKAMDQLKNDGTITDNIFAQIGYSDYEPRYYSFKQFLDQDEFSEMMEQADTVITHGGTGAIIGAVKKRKKVIAVPRLSKYGEHVDDHQTQLVNQFRELNLICACEDCNKLAEALDYVSHTEFSRYKSNTQTIIEDIGEFLRKEE